MDPDATLSLLITALVDGDLWGASDHFDDLMDWLDSGGFTPRDPRT